MIECDAAEAFLVSRINYERTLTVPYQGDFKLDRMRELMARLGDPQLTLNVVHVAGTKGKGSTAAMIAAVLSAAGYRVGLYSSPHLDRVEERIAIDGQPCSHQTLAELVQTVRPAVEALDHAAAVEAGAPRGVTYFETVTAMALCHFAEQRVDFAVLEVGLGGRLDSTNICQPTVAAITSISFDHVQQLGNSLTAIAGEKAGIIKAGVPVVSGVIEAEPRGVIAAVADASGSRLIQLGRDFDFTYHPPRHLEDRPAQGSIDFVNLTAAGPAQNGQTTAAATQYCNLPLGLLGAHQGANAAVAVATLGELRSQGWSIPESALRRGLADVQWPARLEVLRRRPTVLLDAAHNVASVIAFLQAIEESFTARRRVLIFATTRDKDARGMLELLLPRFDEVILTRYANNPRGAPLEELEALAGPISTQRLTICPDPPSAWRQACVEVGPQDLLAITGSFFIAAEMRTAMRENPLPP
jgi:dihydrofolate synthase/folylpolyglutamate synthase